MSNNNILKIMLAYQTQSNLENELDDKNSSDTSSSCALYFIFLSHVILTMIRKIDE
jgi:hypothetical protein